MPDSRFAVEVAEVVTENGEGWLTIARLILVVLIIPMVAVLKKYTKLFSLIDPTDFKLVILFFTLWGISSAAGVDIELEQLLDKALAMLGLAAWMYRKGKNAPTTIKKWGRRTTP